MFLTGDGDRDRDRLAQDLIDRKVARALDCLGGLDHETRDVLAWGGLLGNGYRERLTHTLAAKQIELFVGQKKNES